MNWNKKLIGKNAGIVWNALQDKKMSWEELLAKTRLQPLDLASAIGWLAREDKLYIYPNGDDNYFEIYNESYF